MDILIEIAMGTIVGIECQKLQRGLDDMKNKTKLYPIKDYEEQYAITRMGKIWSYHKDIWLRPVIDRYGYERVCLYENGVCKKMSVHRLMVIQFRKNPLGKLEVNHINGIKNDNREDNLEWSTQSENMIHAYKLGLKKPCTKHLKRYQYKAGAKR